MLFDPLNFFKEMKKNHVLSSCRRNFLDCFVFVSDFLSKSQAAPGVNFDECHPEISEKQHVEFHFLYAPEADVFPATLLKGDV